MLFKSPLFAMASGSVAGTVFSRNAGGMYVRSRSNPTNPNTDAQQAVRDAMRELVNAWSLTLTNVQREQWNTYAFNTPTLNRLGDSTHKTGQQMYIRGNIARLQAELDRADEAPITFDIGTFTAPSTFTADESAQTISLPFNNADDWANEEGAAMLIYMGRPQNATRNFGKGPFQLATLIAGNGTTPPTSPKVFTTLFPMALGQKIFLQIRVTRADGRLSGKANPAVLVTA